MHNSIGKNIAEQRHQAKMTQEQLAELSDMTINYLSKVERGVIKQISSISLYRIAKALGVTMEDLMVGHQVATKPQPNRQLLAQELDLMDPEDSEKFCKAFMQFLKLAQKEK